MKKLAIGLAIAAGLVVAVVVAVPFLVPLDRYKAEIAARTEAATGRRLTIAGDIRLSVIPRLAVTVTDVALANAPGAATPEMLRVRELVLELGLWPLLGGEVAVDRFALIGPELTLEADVGGRPNWDFAGPGETTQAPGAAPAIAGLRLHDVGIEDGALTFIAADGTVHRAGDIALEVSLAALGAPLMAAGEMLVNGEKLTLSGRLETPETLLAEVPTRLSLRLAAAPVVLDVAGELGFGEAAGFSGEIALEGPSLRGFAAWAGAPVDAPRGTLGPFSAKGALSVMGAGFGLEKARLRLDEVRGEGGLAVDLSGERPAIDATLALGRVDLGPYLPPPAEEAASGPADWSDAPIDVAGLRGADARVALRVETLVARAFEVGPAALSLTLVGGDLVVELSEMALYGGSGQARIRLDASGPVPRIEKRVAFSGVEAAPLLAASAGFDRLEGTAAAEFSLAGAGLSERAIVAGLFGEGWVRFTDGAIKGINLAAMVRNVKTAFLDPEAQATQKTDFAELSGSFRMKNGILVNDDARLLAPLLRLAGAGTVDLPARRLSYRVEPKLAATAEGQGGAREVAGVMVPVLIEGPWDDLSYRPDLAGIAAGALADPGSLVEGAKGAVGGLKEGGASAVEGIVEGVGGGSTAPDPLGAVKKLFGD